MILKERFNTHLAIFLASFSIIFSELILLKILSGIRIGFSLASFFVYAGAILGLGIGNFILLSSGRKDHRLKKVAWLNRLSPYIPSFLVLLLIFVIIVSLVLLQFLALGRFFELIMGSMYLIYPAIVFVYCLFGYLIGQIFVSASRKKNTVMTWAFDISGSAVGGILPVLMMGLADPLVLYFVPVLASLALVMVMFRPEGKSRKFMPKLLIPLVLLSAAYIAVIPSIRTYDLLRSAFPREYNSLVDRTIDNFEGFFTSKYSMNYIGWSPYRKLNYFESDSAYMVTYDNATTTALMKENRPFRPASLFLYPEQSDNTLIIGAGCGGQIPFLLTMSDSITAVELDPLVVEFASSHAGPDHFIHSPDVTYLSYEGLAYLKKHPGPYSYILFPLTDTFITSAAQSLVKAENYLYTTEGLETSISSLSDDGCLVIALASAMNQYGSDIMNRSFPTVAVHLFRNLLEIGVPLENFAIAAASDYISGGVFLIYDKGGLNRARFDSLLASAVYVDIVLTDSEEFIRFASSTETTTNDRPFFYIAGKIPPPPLMLAALFLALSAVIPISLLFYKARRKGALQGLNHTFMRTEILYAVCTGFGFMGMGTLLIQRVIPIFGAPYLAGTVIITALLAGAGIVSVLMGKRDIGWKGMTVLSVCSLLIVPIAALFDVNTFSILIQLSLIPRILLTFALFLPVGIVLGAFFPKLLQITSARSEAHVILAYGTDVTFSIIGIVFSLVIPVMLGYRFMFLLVGLAYVGVAIMLQRLKRLEGYSTTD